MSKKINTNNQPTVESLRNTIILGDCIDELNKIPDNSIDLRNIHLYLSKITGNAFL